MTTDDKRKARADADTALRDAEVALAATKKTLARDPADAAALAACETAQRTHDRARLLAEAHATAHDEAVAADAAAAKVAEKSERAAMLAASSFSAVHAKVAPQIAELVALETHAAEIVKAIAVEIRKANGLHMRATNGSAGTFTEAVAREIVRERIARDRLRTARHGDPVVAPWFDPNAKPVTSDEINARDVAQRAITPIRRPAA